MLELPFQMAELGFQTPEVPFQNLVRPTYSLQVVSTSLISSARNKLLTS
jgi:hypothetical protein